MNIKKIKYITAAVIIFLMGIVTIQNFEDQVVVILFTKIKMPLAFMFILTFASGMIAGWILSLLTKRNKTPKAQD